MAYPDIDLYVDGQWRQAAGRPVINPADETRARHRAAATTPISTTRSPPPRQGFKVWRKHLAGQARRDHPQGRQPHPRARRGDGGRHDAGAGQADRAGAARNPARLPTSSNGTPPRAAASYGRIIPSEPGMRHTVLRQPIGAGRRVLAVEFPDELAGPQGRRRAVGRLLDHPEGVGGDARPARCNWCAPSTMRACRPACSTWCSAIPPRSPSYLIPHPSSGSSPSPARSRSASSWPRWRAST